MSDTTQDPVEYARRHYDADAEALGPGGVLEVDAPVAWLSGLEEVPGDEAWRDEVEREYRRLRDEHGGRPRP